jgi:CubicO group peptidase (beta-lactamase class C family)
MDGAKLDGIHQELREAVENSEISGAVTLIARRGAVVHWSAVGRADIKADRPMRTDTMFAVASMTKPVTATAVMMLVDEGRLSLDDPAHKYIPAFKRTRLASGPPKRDITIRDLLTHTSGVAGDQRNIESLAKTADAVAARPLAFEPGSRWQYSPGISVCGRVVEVVSGMPYEKYLQTKLFDPLGMKDTTFFPSRSQQERTATLYKPGKEKAALEPAESWISEVSPARSANPSAGLFSTAADMARFYQMILQQGELDGRRVLSAAAVRAMTSVQTGDLKTGFTPGCGWGLGWCVVRKPQGVTGMLSPGSYGHGGAFGTQGWIDPRRKMVFVLMIQRTGFGNSDGSELRRRFQQSAVDALRWESAIRALQERDRRDPPASGSVVFVGSSSIRRWDLPTYFPNLPVVNSGFGGSHMADSVEFADRIVTRHKPRVVVVFAGGNDIAAGKRAETVAADFRQLAEAIHSELPKTRIVCISIKPSEKRWKMIGEIRKTNALLEKFAQQDCRIVYVDVDRPMLGPDGKPRRELLHADGLHLSPAGYALWTSLVRPHLDTE